MSYFFNPAGLRNGAGITGEVTNSHRIIAGVNLDSHINIVLFYSNWPVKKTKMRGINPLLSLKNQALHVKPFGKIKHGKRCGYCRHYSGNSREGSDHALPPLGWFCRKFQLSKTRGRFFMPVGSGRDGGVENIQSTGQRALSRLAAKEVGA